MKQREAELFADIAHSSIGQRRKYTNDPYIVHPKNVAYLVKIACGTDDMISAAFLHDVLEDVAPVNPLFGKEEILKRFGKEVLLLVEALTDISKPEDGNRQKRKSLEREKYKLASNQVKTIKLADLIDNSLTICQYDKEFAKVYLREKELLLPYLFGGSSSLWKLANDILIKNQNELYNEY